MIIEIEKNPSKVFIRRGDNRRFRTSPKIIDGKIVDYFISDLTSGVLTECISLEDDWELAPEEVTWQKAIEAWLDGKDIKCETGTSIYDYCLNGFKTISKNELLNGKWYIKN